MIVEQNLRGDSKAPAPTAARCIFQMLANRNSDNADESSQRIDTHNTSVVPRAVIQALRLSVNSTTTFLTLN